MASIPNIPGWNNPRVKFVEQVETNMCCACNRMLYQPMQTSCGHKLCSPCFEELIATADEVDCPGNDETCEKVNKYSVYPDFATFREMSKMSVYCPNQDAGCDFTGKFMEIQNHLEQCSHKQLSCPIEGCSFQGSTSTLEEHMSTSSAQHTVLLAKSFAAITVLHKTEVETIRSEARTAAEESRKAIQALKERNQQQAENNDALQARLETMERELRALREQQGNPTTAPDIPPTAPDMTDFNAQLEMLQCRQKSVEDDVKKVWQIVMTSSTRLTGLTVHPSAAQNATYATIYTWLVTNYSQRKQDEITGKTPYLDSEPFFCGGYKMCARLYLNGDGIGKGSNLSLYLSLVKGENDDRLAWPFKHRISMVLMNQLNSNNKIVQEQFDPVPTSASYQRPKTMRNKGTGFPLFSTHALAESPQCLVNDSIKILIQVDSRAVS